MASKRAPAGRDAEPAAKKPARRPPAKASTELEKADTPIRVPSTRADGGPAKELALRPKAGRLGATGTTHQIQTTMEPTKTITVSETEYQQLLAQGLVYSGSPVAPVADFYDGILADKVANGSAFPAALGAAAADSGSPFGSELRAAFVPRPGGSLTIVLGDSIDQGADQEDFYSGGSVFSDLCLLSGQRVKWLRNSGIAGNTTAQVLARVQTDAIDHNPGIVIIGGGVTNDQGAGVDPTTTRANLTAIRDALWQAGITVVARTETPIDVTGTGAFATVDQRRAGVQQHNAWLKAWAGNSGIPVLDYYAPLVDEATGGYVAGYSDDGIHPNVPTGQIVAAQAVVDAGLPAVFTGTPQLTTAVGDASDLLAGTGLFTGAPTNGLASGWSASGSAATLTVDADTAIPGNWQHISGVASGSAVVQSPDNHLTGFAPGDVLEFAGRAEKGGSGDAYIRLQVGDINAWNYQLSPVAGVRVIDGTFAGRITVPAAQDYIGVQMVINAGATLRVSQVTVTNLTALGAL